MKISYKIALLAIPFAIISFVLGRIIWPDPVGMVGPSTPLLPHFIFISALESVAFGIGLSFAILGWMKFGKQLLADKLSLFAFIATIWTLISWWPHDNMHRVNGMDNFAGLIKIEYTFHFTLIICGFIVASYLWRQISRNFNG